MGIIRKIEFRLLEDRQMSIDPVLVENVEMSADTVKIDYDGEKLVINREDFEHYPGWITFCTRLRTFFEITGDL